MSDNQDAVDEQAAEKNDNTAQTQEAATQPEKRKGFHPVLIISTIAVVLFVLWFCPWALMRAHASYNEDIAISTLQNISGNLVKLQAVKSLQDTAKINDKNLRTAVIKYVPAATILADNVPIAWLTPRTYGCSTKRTFCRYKSVIYAKDLGKKIRKASDLSAPDDSWEKVTEVHD